MTYEQRYGDEPLESDLRARVLWYHGRRVWKKAQAEMEDQVARLESRLLRFATDWEEIDTAVHVAARQVLGSQVDGDAAGAPPLEAVVGMLVATIKDLREELAQFQNTAGA